MRTILTLCLAIFILTNFVNGQCDPDNPPVFPVGAPPCNDVDRAAEPNCEDFDPPLCDLYDIEGFCSCNPVGGGSGAQFCGAGTSLDNPVYFKFVASSSPVDIAVYWANCTGGNNGNIQVAVYEECNTSSEACLDSDADCNNNRNPARLYFEGAIPGQTYTVLVDGCAGSVCDFNVRIVKGGGGECFDTGIYTGVFYDENQNGARETNEFLIGGAEFEVNPGAIVKSSLSTRLRPIPLSEGNYNLATTVPDGYMVTSGNASIDFDIEPLSDLDTFLIGAYPTTPLDSVQLLLRDPSIFRCNAEANFFAELKNSGNTILNGILWVELDDRTTAPKFNIEPDTIDSFFKRGWFVEDLFLNGLFGRQFALRMPDSRSEGEILVFKTYFEGQNNEIIEQEEVARSLRCAIDPNDKRVLPNRPDNKNLLGERIVYSLRFQNTGSDTAFLVSIQDTISPLLDLSTLKVIGTSHPDELEVVYGPDRLVDFRFPDIMLVDSMTNPALSNGEVTFSIDPIDGLSSGSTVYNTGYIYFDSNDAVVTNTTETVYVEDFVTSVQNINTSFISLYPNPAFSEVSIIHSDWDRAELSIHDINGKKVYQDTWQINGALDISFLQSGVYFLSLEKDRKRTVTKLIKE